MKTLTTYQAWGLLKAYVRRHDSQRAAAEALGISPAYLTDLMKGRRTLTDTVCSKLNLRRVVRTETVYEVLP